MITRIAQLHKKECIIYIRETLGPQKTKIRGTLIINLPTQEMQATVAYKEVVIDSLQYEARLYHYGVKVR